MSKFFTGLAGLAGTVLLIGTPMAQSQTAASAAQPPGISTTAPSRTYGWQLMSPQERTEFRSKLHSLKTPEEREQFRKDHHEQMKARAKERGLTLPDEPLPMAGPRSGPGRGQGPGKPNPQRMGQ